MHHIFVLALDLTLILAVKVTTAIFINLIIVIVIVIIIIIFVIITPTPVTKEAARDLDQFQQTPELYPPASLYFWMTAIMYFYDIDD